MESKIPIDIIHCCEYVFRDYSFIDDDVKLTAEDKEIVLYRRLFRNYQSCQIEWGLFLASLRKAYIDSKDVEVSQPPKNVAEEQVSDCRKLVNIVSIMPTMEFAKTFLRHNLLETHYPRTFATYYFVLILRVPSILQTISYEEFERETGINFAQSHVKLPVHLIKISYDANSCKEEFFQMARDDQKTRFAYMVNDIADYNIIVSMGLREYVWDLPGSLLEFSTQLASLEFLKDNGSSTSANGSEFLRTVTVGEVKDGYQKISKTRGLLNIDEISLMQVRYVLFFDEFGGEARLATPSACNKITAYTWPVCIIWLYIKFRTYLGVPGKIFNYIINILYALLNRNR